MDLVKSDCFSVLNFVVSILWNLMNSEETVYVCSNHIREHYAPNWLNNVTKILGFFLFRNLAFPYYFFTLPRKSKYHISN